MNPACNVLISQLSSEKCEILLPHLQLSCLEAGQLIFRPQELIQFAYFPVTTIIALQIDISDGSSADIAWVGKEGMVGSGVMGSNQNFSRARVKFSGFAYKLPLQIFQSELAQDRAFLKIWMAATRQMIRQGSGGHIINISSIGVLASSPRFSAYVASKAALDAFSRCAQAEFSGKNIAFTTVNMPLVKTPMIAPTKMYESVPTLTPEEAADLVVKAIIERPSRVATRMGIFAATLNALVPKAYEVIMNTAFEMFPDSAAAKGDRKALKDERPTNEQVAFAALMRGVHW